MRDVVSARLDGLRQEYEAGQKMLLDLDERRMELQQTLLRISGATQVLEELLAETDPAAASDDAAQVPQPSLR